MELASSSSDMNFKITLVDEKQLIELVKVNKCLYDTGDENYGISKFVNDVWEEIGNRINVSPKQCTVIWMNLRNEYLKHFEKKGPNKANDLVKHMHFLWPFYIKRFCNEVNFCTSNVKYILDNNGLVADGFNYRLIRTVAKFQDIYSRQSLPHDQHHQNSWELVSQRLDETVKCCFTQWVRLRKYYIDSLISKFSSDPVSAKPTTKFEFRMKFLYPEVKDLIPYSRENFYDSTDIKDIVIDVNEGTNPNNNTADSSIDDPSSSTSDEKIPRIIIPIPKIQTKFTTEFKRKFINKVEGYPTLYSIISWENSRQKYLWAKFTNIDNVKIAAQECCNLWISLKNTYISIIRKIYPYKKCNKVVSNWEFYNDMLFLWPYFKDKDAALVEVIVRPSLNETIKSESVIYEEIFNIYNSEHDEVIKFIELVKKYPVLYMNKKFNQVTPNSKLKLKTWNYLAKFTPWLVRECEELWLLLYKQYVLYLNDHKSTFDDMIYKDAMSFLKSFIEEDGLILNETTNYISDSPIVIKHQNDTLLESLETVPIVKFIKSVEKFKILYDNTDLSEDCKYKLWNAVSKDVQISPKICAEKWAELREKYTSMQSKTSLSQEDVFYSNYMQFLAPYIMKPASSTQTPLTSQDILNNYESMSSEYKFEMAKKIILEVQKYPRIYLRSPHNKGSLQDFEKIAKVLKIPSSICEKVFRNAEQNYLERSLDRVLNPSLDPYILEKELEYTKPEVDKKVKRWLISNGNRLLVIVKEYPELHLYNSMEFLKSPHWKTIAKEMNWRVSSCTKLWQIIISEYKELKENGISESNWAFKKTFEFSGKTDSSQESVDDSVWNLTLDYYNVTLIHEVKKYPCLYDPAIKVFNKELIWKTIAITLSSSIEDTKKQWTRLKDIFVAVMNEKIEGPIDKVQELLGELSFLKPIFGSKKEYTKSNEKKVEEKKPNKKKEIKKYEKQNPKLFKRDTTEENVTNSITMAEIDGENTISYTMENVQVNNTPRMMDFQIFGGNGLNDNIEQTIETKAEILTESITKSQPNTRYEYFTITKLYSDSESDLEDENPKVEIISLDDDDEDEDGCSDTQKRNYEKPNVSSAPDIVKKRKI